ncbi:hypothetical protein J3D54_000201 [Pseudomonas sp. GGS8]|uniref:hypothetical protein n=1 Tax=Pseudomonas sp. GGS8 TaxID=2817892 RepID=UPI0020A084C1|nr:hypothetical protein [Pseudomonas sp. GGS8]MCP1441069.1 hypothetical protein [Pseudomonas sp. GGS8]
MNNPAFNSGSIAVLALTLPYIPRQTYPINHPDAQVGLSRVNYYADPLGLLVLLGPYQGQASNETGRLYLNNLPLALSTDVTKDAVTPLEFRLPVGMLSNGINTLKCTVTRQSGNEDSAELVVLHSLADPAGNDPDPNAGNLLLNIDVNPKSVGPAEAAAGVRVILDYPGKQLYDSLSIDCGGKVITHQIAPTLQDPNPETKPIVRTLYAADFAHAPNDPQFAFKYNVISQVGDFSGTSLTGVFNPQKFWSKSCLIDVHLDRNELEMPILREILTENNDDPAVVDLDKMKGGPLWALIHLIQKVWQAGDEIHLMFTAVDSNGTVVATYEVTLTIGPVPGQMSVDIPSVKVIADSKVSVVYEQIREGKVIGVSEAAEAQVIGRDTSFEDFETWPLRGFTAGEIYDADTMVMSVILGAVGIAESAFLPDNGPNGRVLFNGNARSQISLKLKKICSQVSFMYRYVDYVGSSAHSYDGKGNLLETLPFLPPRDAKQISFTIPGIEQIVIDNFGTSDSFYVDKISLIS